MASDRRLCRRRDAHALGEESDAKVSDDLRRSEWTPEAVGKRGEAFVARALREQEEAEALAGKAEGAAPVSGRAVARAADAMEPARGVAAEWVPIARGRRRRRVGGPLWLVAAAILVGAAATTVATIVMRDEPTPKGPDVPREQPRPEPTESQVAAAKLRQDATDACGRGEWVVCVAKLDEAKRADPAGESAGGGGGAAGRRRRRGWRGRWIRRGERAGRGGDGASLWLGRGASAGFVVAGRDELGFARSSGESFSMRAISVSSARSRIATHSAMGSGAGGGAGGVAGMGGT